MKVSVAALRKVLRAQLASVEGRSAKDQNKEIAERLTSLKDAVVRAERYIKRIKEAIAEGGPAVLGEFSAPPNFYSNRRRNGEAGSEIRRALKLLDLSSTDELTLADATRLVGKQIIEAL